MSANAFKVAIHRLRGKFRDALRAEVAGTQPDGGDVDEEIRYLMQALGND
jgi:RNA polymerase sigma-70 factor (ECF subfamily)